MRNVYDTLEMLKSYPNTIVKQTNENLQEIQQLFNEKYAGIDNEINYIKQLTSQIQKIQAVNRVREVIQSQGQSVETIQNLKKEEVKKIPELEEVKLPKLNQSQRLTQSTASTLENNSEKKHQEKIEKAFSYNSDCKPLCLNFSVEEIIPPFHVPPSTGMESSNTMLQSTYSNPFD
jgi:DNA polymerase III alpha subunit (gram-positive type)